MKPRIDFIVNAVCLFALSPLLGMMATGIVVAVLEAGMWTVAAIAGLVSTIFFDVNFTAVQSRMLIIRHVEMWLIFGGGSVGGIIWSCLEIKQKWQEHKAIGKRW